MTQHIEINAFDRIMLVLANKVAKNAGLPEFYAPHIFTSLSEEAQLIAAAKKHFTMVWDGDGFTLVPLKGKA